MKHSHRYLTGILVLLAAGVICLYSPSRLPAVQDGYFEGVMAEEWNQLIAGDANETGITLVVDGSTKKPSETSVYMDGNRQLMLPVDAVKSLFQCSAAVYEEKTLKIFRNTRFIEADLSERIVTFGDEERLYTDPFVKKGNTYYVSAQVIADGLDYDCSFDEESKTLRMTDRSPLASRLPVSYDGRTLGRTPEVRNQGTLGTCWAFAAISALEASLLPEENWEFSVDHMSLNNFFGRSQEIGGEYTMAMSYLLAWKGPVLEADDPYGDKKTDPTLEAKRHVQEIQIIPKKDLNGIKEAVYQYGGVQTSLFSSLTSADSDSEHYNPEMAAYYYVGTEKMNHDVLIVGWDDNFPKTAFRTEPEGNGAFLCMNSWGKNFGDGGFFWVSYFDSSIGIYNIVYTGI